MIGNDIVDLHLAKNQNDWRRKGYLAKVFNRSEQLLIHNAKDQDKMVWLLWSMKESAYKILNRLTGERLFNPSLFACELLCGSDKKIAGNVKKSDYIFPTKSSLNENHVHTVACTKRENLNKTITFLDSYNPDYLKIFNDSNGLLLTKDNNRLPQIFDSKTSIPHPASISHHGGYLCVSYLP